jgi:hypothetical protein
MTKSRTIKFAAYVAYIWEKRNERNILGGNPKEKRQIEDLGIDGTIKLNGS